ncbi:MAG: beta-galactosidase [Candidatus Magasanikbacteria bacterium]|nr:beta-galactosidase [Candidatus Magasanikbacteria bacterium]
MMKKILIIIGIIVACGYSALWVMSAKQYPVTYGISFSKNYANDLELDWKKTYIDILTELKPAYIRLGAEWNGIETEQGKFNFSDLDFMMNEAEKHNAKVLLAIGQKVPRWPECHYPLWYRDLNPKEQREATLNYIEKTVANYKNHPALEIWQVENEPYISFDFGECKIFNRDLVKYEIALVQQLDPNHRTVITDSGEMSLWHETVQAGDLFGTTLYRAVAGPMGWKFYYNWLPPGLYKVRAFWQGRTPQTFFISELQAEPWYSGTGPKDTPIKEQELTMSPKRLQANMDVAERTGASRAYLWGVEWWYFMKEKNNDARYWELVKNKLAE